MIVKFPNAKLPSRELTYPSDKAYLKMTFLFPRWDMLIPWRVSFIYFEGLHVHARDLSPGPRGDFSVDSGANQKNPGEYWK